MGAQGLQWGEGQPWWDVDRWASAWWADGRAGRDLCKTGAAAFVTWAHGMRRVAQEKIAGWRISGADCQSLVGVSSIVRVIVISAG